MDKENNIREEYRNCEIYSKKEKSLGGDMVIYWGVIASNGFWVEDEYGNVADVEAGIRRAKASADKFLDEFDGDTKKWNRHITG